MDQERTYPYFTNTACPYFPCHADADPRNFNCVFCYCPLYPLGVRCGGNFSMLADGTKDCSGCTRPHERDAGTRLVMEKWPELQALARANAGSGQGVEGA